MDRSGLTFPMICTAFPFERWASCRVGISPCQLAGSEPKNDNKNKTSAKNEKRKEKEKTRKNKEKPLPRKEEGGGRGVQDCNTGLGYGMAQKLDEIVTYTIQVCGDVAVRVDDCGLSSKLDDTADDDDIAALVRVQVGRGDTGCRLGLHAAAG